MKALNEKINNLYQSQNKNMGGKGLLWMALIFAALSCYFFMPNIFSEGVIDRGVFRYLIIAFAFFATLSFTSYFYIYSNRSNINKDTAQTLRGRMNNSKGLAYVATSNSTNLKWCPWELGYFDGKKNSRCCILPIMESQNFNGQEYLGLYPYLEYAEYSNKNQYEFLVDNQENDEYVILREWLNGKEPYKH